MKKFKELSKEKTSVVEKEILKQWKEKDLFYQTIENREKEEPFVFYDGPATANGFPGVHHMMAKFLKDSFCKYKTMQGYKVLRKVGWDTHGLPVELEVEKELGFTSKGDIETYGIKPFNQKCRESVWKNETAFRELTESMGQFIDLEHPYVTYDNNYIETEWWILKKFFDEGMIYEGHKILPFCPRCGTGLASHEVAQGYKEIDVDTVIVPMKLKSEENTYFLVWTTTPWTLLANVALCVNPNETYIKAESKGYQFILAKALADKVLGEDYKVLKTYQGKDLEYLEYEQLLPFLKVEKKAFFVTCDTYVTMEDGTGIVHIAPAFGADDYAVGKRYHLPVVNPVGENGVYLEGPWKDTFVMDADKEVIKYLKEQDKLFKKERMKHNYPHCWRCSSPLLYYSKPSWYIEVTKITDKIIEQNKTVHWHPDFVGEKRFANWLENLNDWAISRSRYWGTPLPLWTCDCGHMEMIGSRKELCEKALEEIDETIDLHRPYVDDVHIKCCDCGKTMHRVRDVIDCWFDSGSMPFAQYHYPFENKELFEEQFPADFICEGVDQTRGWFYTLLVISTFVMGKAPYKNVLVNDLLLDKYGKKMSKSKGNKLDPFEMMESFGADTIRWYLPYVSPVWTPTRFDTEGLKEVYSKFFNTLRNTYNFFALYANTDEIDPRTFDVSYDELEEIDKWLLSKYHTLLAYVTASYEEYDLTKVVRSVTDFVNEDLSNWYIRRNRRRFWASELDVSKKAVYKTTYDVLLGLMKIIAPIVPFVSEEIYQNLVGSEEKSVHLEDFPVADEKYQNKKIEERMDLVRDLISLGRYAREEVKVKVRQPIKEVILDGKYRSFIEDLTPLIMEELNVKTVTFEDQLEDYIEVTIKPNFKVAGKVFGSKMKEFASYLSTLTMEDIHCLEQGEIYQVTFEDVSYDIPYEFLDVRITAKEGYNAGMENHKFIILNMNLTEELKEEGLARELISKVQQLRKTRDYNVLDKIEIIYDGDALFEKAISKYIEFIQQETLAETIQYHQNDGDVYDINGYNITLQIKKR